jgi:NTP pyrophosphatase (non-canonical NTP hydrolase)
MTKKKTPEATNYPGQPPVDPAAGVNVNFDQQDAASAAAEKLSNAAKDLEEEMKTKLDDMEEDTPKTPEEFINKKGFNAWVTASKIKEKEEEKKTEKTDPDRFRVDLDKYLEFADKTCSNPSKKQDQYIERLRELKEEGCDIARLDTAASGICAEGGEFMEIVKKLKFQGKPWNDANKEHLVKELGDVMWYVAQACHALDVTFDHVIYVNSLKLAARYADGSFSVQESENRKVGDI